MPSYKFTYFNGRGKGEVTRLVFALAGQEFEDVRITREDWPALKPETPLGQIPVLQIDNGKMIPHSVAITSYLARKFDFYGSSNEDALMIDVIFHTLLDFVTPRNMAVFYEKDELKKAEKLKEFYKTAPYFLKVLEKMLIRNGGGDGFFVGDKISLADIALYANLEQGFDKRSDILEPFPKLVRLRDRVASEPKIAEYLAKRPEATF